jgi:hypothetical protein
MYLDPSVTYVPGPYLTVGFLLTALPAHIINLKYFEEYVLELRYGLSYLEYRRRVPFLIPRFSRRGQGAAQQAAAADEARLECRWLSQLPLASLCRALRLNRAVRRRVIGIRVGPSRSLWPR